MILRGRRIELRSVPSSYDAALIKLRDETAPVVDQTHPDPVGAFTLSAPEPGFWQLVVKARGKVASHTLLVPSFAPRQLPTIVRRGW